MLDFFNGMVYTVLVMKNISDFTSKLALPLDINDIQKHVKCYRKNITETNAKMVISFNEKVSWNGNRKINECRVNFELRPNSVTENLMLSISGDIWNLTKTDCMSAGQCLDTMLEYAKAAHWQSGAIAILEEIITLWTKYHLNGMYSGHTTGFDEEDLPKIWKYFSL